jgi:hypothetical protein
MSKIGGVKPGIAQGRGTDGSRIGEALEKGVEMVRETVLVVLIHSKKALFLLEIAAIFQECH